MGRTVDNVNHDPRDADVLESIHAIMHLFRARRHEAMREEHHDLSHMEGKVLGFFTRQPGSTLSDLVAHTGRDKGQLARLVAGLKERGLLEARTDEADRRSVRLEPTAEAQAIHQTMLRHARRLSEVAVSGLSADERRQLVSLLEKVRTNLEAPGC
ncbi:MarR family winged helix-turn-helix transcriptional regulator [Polyangium jinanense]|uniref:Winged helix-turn-helix transcriptional regulator n=1 Tax=Polyangium jinanense TaxID=2829994 RepID=A0A9X4AVJ2_9BACT|nr:MarR family winged helix-turn-helix transcriptional regulator [Polyangium jinanense]MDC3958986.1 winged helix-turn-helix transcriptional regulator [Polyangium jinanense]MDC3986389.1 winged helix-turn-helix transcriptional regulator [Polyangium jinanense]